MASTLHIAPGQDEFELMLSGDLDAETVDQLRAHSMSSRPNSRSSSTSPASTRSTAAGIELLADVNKVHRSAGNSLRLNRAAQNNRVLSLLEELELTEHFTFD